MAVTSNTLSGLIPTIYTALDTVSRELIGFIPNVSRDARAEGAALNQTVTAHVAPAVTTSSITPGATADFDGGQTIGTTNVSITKSKKVEILWNGEEQMSVSQSYAGILQDQFAQAFRALANEVEGDIGALYKNMAYAAGTPGTTPFSTNNDHTDFARANELLDIQGAPQSERVMIVGSAARAMLEGKQTGLFHVNEAGDGGDALRRRIQRQLHGFTMGYSAGVKKHTAGTFATKTADGGNSAGEMAIKYKTGAATVVAGEVLKLGSDTSPYVTAGSTTVDLALNAPLLKAVADTTTIAFQSYTANMAFHRNALLLVARTPAMPQGGDNADDVTIVTDPVSGLSFQVALYRMYRATKIEVGLAWGVAAPNGKHGVILAG